MPFGTITLNDGRKIPGINFGTWKIPNDVCTAQTDQAISVGFDAIDTAQVYRNETEAGQAIKDSGLARNELWITTKWSGLWMEEKKLDVQESCEASLKKLGLDYVDLYLIHHPRLCEGDIPGTWKKMEALLSAGLVKSIGVSNFSIDDLKVLLASCSVKPVVNQILLHPYVIAETTPLLDFMASQNIVPEGYSTLIPLTSKPGGPVDKPVAKLAEKYSAKPEQILLAWSKAKGAVVITTSSKKERLENYLKVGDIYLTEEDVEAIDAAGSKKAVWEARAVKGRKMAKYAAVGFLTGYTLFKVFA